MVEMITNVNSAINGFVWGIPMLVLLVGTGILMTALTKFFQLSHIGHWFKKYHRWYFQRQTYHTAHGQGRSVHLPVPVTVYGTRRHHRYR